MHARARSVPPRRRVEVGDLVRRDFSAPDAGLKWFTDLTMIRTGEGWLRAAVVLDAFNRKVIAWSTDAIETPRTALTALAEAIRVANPKPGCIIHSDRGYQFTMHDWIDLATRHGLRVSIGERKDPRDNAAMESWFGSFKNEALYPVGQPRSRAEARERLFNYIWDYNQHRLHSSLGYRTPADYATINQ